MRNAFAQTLTELAAADPRIVLLSGDIGNHLFDDYKTQLGEGRFLNCGVAEQNMIGVSAGLAMCGLRPVAYTIAPFITARCLEQVRVDFCYHDLPGVIVGVGAGLSYASLGATHHACEDIAMLRSLPGMTVVCPGDAHEVRAALRAAVACDGPVYLRLGKKGEPLVHTGEPDFAIGRGIVVREGDEACLLSTGTVLPIAMAAADTLASQGVSARVVSLHTVKPLDDALLEHAFASFAVVASIEEHGAAGGLGGAVAEWLVDRPRLCQRTRLVRLGTGDAFFHEPGDPTYARQRLGLTAQDIATRVRESLGVRATGKQEATA